MRRAYVLRLLFGAFAVMLMTAAAPAAPSQHPAAAHSPQGAAAPGQQGAAAPGRQAAPANPTAQGAKGAKSATAGNGSSGNGNAEGILVAEIVLLLAVGRLLGEGMQRIGQPALIGQLLAGIILGPSLFGWLWPGAQHFLFPADASQRGMIDGISQVGILLLLLLTGMETDLKLVRKSGFAAVAISLSGIILPFACGFELGQFLPQSLAPGGSRLVTSLFLGTALSISSIKIVAMVVREMNFMRRNLGQIIVATAIMEDTVGWVIVAITFGIAGVGGGGAKSAHLWGLAETVGGVFLFLLFCFTLGRWLVFTAIRWANDTFRSEFPVVTVILIIMGCFAMVTQLLGVRTVLGAFMAGVLVGESPILGRHIQQQLRGMITAFFMPIFFGMSGLSADLTILKSPMLALLTAALVMIASLGKFSGAFVGSIIGRLKWRDGIALGCAMNARGSTEVIVASIGLSMGALSQNLYTMIVTMAVATTMAMPAMLRAALARVPLEKEEKIRIEREEIDERGFLPGLERLLVAVDDSSVGRFTARLAGLVAGARGMPVTILTIANGHIKAPDPDLPPLKDDVARAVKTGAKASAEKTLQDDAEPDPEKVHLTEQGTQRKTQGQKAGDAVAQEAQKGYDLLFLGLQQSRRKDGGFSQTVTEIAQQFGGNLALLAHDGEIGELNSRSRILVAVNGAEASRRAAEVAFAAARATRASVTAIYVSQAETKVHTRRREEGVLKDITVLAERYDVNVQSHIAARGAAADMILKEANRGKYHLIVLGVNVRPSEELFFGNTATQILGAWKRPVLFLASRPNETKRDPGEAKNNNAPA